MPADRDGVVATGTDTDAMMTFQSRGHAAGGNMERFQSKCVKDRRGADKQYGAIQAGPGKWGSERNHADSFAG
jgi:hypothetical protein